MRPGDECQEPSMLFRRERPALSDVHNKQNVEDRIEGIVIAIKRHEMNQHRYLDFV